MEAKYQSVLDALGLKTKQAKVYLAALETGGGSVQDIAKKAGVKRTTVYTIARELKNRGFFYLKKNKSGAYFVADSPKDIIERLKNQLDSIYKNKTSSPINKQISFSKTKVFVFENADGFKKIWQIIFNSNLKEYLIITDPREMLGFVEKGYITDKIIREKNRLGIKSRQIIASSEYAKEIIAKDEKEGRISKVLPHIYKLPYTTIIFGPNTVFISPLLENSILLIESGDFAKTQRSFFEALWESRLLINKKTA